MERIIKVKNFLRKTYKPKEAPWKRKALFFVSLILIVISGIAAYIQHYYLWTNDNVWIVIALFSLISLFGLFVSIFCKDFWVALFLGKL